jgi:hypothetical protein
VAGSNSDTIIKVGASIAGGILIALQGLNLQSTAVVKNEAVRVEHEQSEEFKAISQALKYQQEGLNRLTAIEQELEELKNTQAAHQTPSPTK